MTTTWIADERVVFLHPDGRRVFGRIAVGMPVQIETTEAHCWIALDGFHCNPQPLIGTSTLHALLIAVRFLGWRLHDFLSTGGRVLDSEDNDFTLESLFGPLLEKANGDPSIMDQFIDEPNTDEPNTDESE